MQRILLNEAWQMRKCGEQRSLSCSVPCSVYHTLQMHGKIEDPYYRENADDAFALSEEDYEFIRTFPKPDASGTHCELCFDGIDTLAEIYLNGVLVGKTDNMHRRWRFPVEGLLEKQNTLKVIIRSPLRYIAEKQAKRPLWGVNSTVAGFPHIRKAHYMFGWDWGPQLPDMGLWRDVYLESWSDGRIEHCLYRQEHTEEYVVLTAQAQFCCDRMLYCRLTVFDPDGALVRETNLVPIADNHASCRVKIRNPRLWWARGYGEQPLYTAKLTLLDGQGTVLGEEDTRIGLRTLTVRQDPDEWGESFCLNLNGRDIFAMGANLIPFDQILPRVTRAQVEHLLESCVKANFNVVRIWGGGLYPDEVFYNYCDEHGLIVWQDFMFACANYLLTDEFWETTEAELRDNIVRLRNHASLGMWCGNNEIETAFETWGLPADPEAKAHYLEQFERRMPAIVQELDPDRFYWRSSPSAYGGCKDTASNHAGDMHYWEVWHAFKPFTAFRELYYRFCSEYGFESVPNLKTMLTVCDLDKGDLNLMSPVMETHQKCEQGNEKLMYYLAQMMRYPESFPALIYNSQLMQAEYIRTCVEHMRRARGRCMGSVYWQLNDTNPVISWSSIDYCGRWKALQHYAKRFHAPVLLSVDEGMLFNLSNETLQDVEGTVHWALRDARSAVVASGSMKAACPALSAKDLGVPELGDYARILGNERENCRYYVTYAFETKDGICSEGSRLFVVPKKFRFLKPRISVKIAEKPDCYAITLAADAYVMAVCLDCRTLDLEFSDNWFDLHGGKPVTVTVPKSNGLTFRTLKNELTVTGTCE